MLKSEILLAEQHTQTNPRHRAGLLAFLLIIFFFAHHADCALWKIGATKKYAQPSDVAALVASGDTVEIDAGTYNDCASWYTDNLLLRGVGGNVHLQNTTCSQKGIWNLFGNNITIDGIEFSGAVSDTASDNGAGIRAQGGSFTVRNCYIHHNQMGVLASMTDSANVVIEHCVFAYNISPNPALFAHNVYINTCDTFIFRYNYVHGAQVGHNVKSRAFVNFILYNRIMDEADGSASRAIDLPNGGQAYIIGNEIEKGASAPNTNTAAFGLEGMINPGPQNLFVASNTFVNDLPSRGIYFNIPSTGFDTLQLVNNIFAGTGVLLNGNYKFLDTAANLVTTSIAAAGLPEASRYDYHLGATSPAINRGIIAGIADGFSLQPIFEYVDTASARSRTIHNVSDIGAFEYHPANGVDEQRGAVLSGAITITHDPAFHYLNITVNNPAQSEKIFSLVDMLGRSAAPKIISRENNITMRTAVLPDGIYFLRVIASATTVLEKILMVR